LVFTSFFRCGVLSELFLMNGRIRLRCAPANPPLPVAAEGPNFDGQ
jgi:hypothetical protein